MNVIWFFMIILSIIYAIWQGNINVINTSILSSPANAVNFTISMIGNICLWLGIMRIAEKAGLIESIAKFVKPLIKKLFPEIPSTHEAFNSMTLSLVANMIGIGNAATAFGLKAMTQLQKLNINKEIASNSMCLFIIINSFMVQLIHTNSLYLRSLAGSTQPALVMPAITVATFITMILGIIVTKFFEKLYRKSL